MELVFTGHEPQEVRHAVEVLQEKRADRHKMRGGGIFCDTANGSFGAAANSAGLMEKGGAEGFSRLDKALEFYGAGLMGFYLDIKFFQVFWEEFGEV